jgi:hypothetical protein
MNSPVIIWRCPACVTPIPLGTLDRPDPDVIYRCPTCRLDWVLDERRGMVVLANALRPAQEVTDLDVMSALRAYGSSDSDRLFLLATN